MDNSAHPAEEQRFHGDTTPGGFAPVHQIPPARIVSIEHPCIIRNLENGVKSLGGEAQIKHVLEHRIGDSKTNGKASSRPEPVVGVSLRPHDPFAQKIPSVGVETRNVLLRICVPMRTGRKRKRGSDGAFEEPPQPAAQTTNLTARELRRRMQDTEGRYTVEAMGMLCETHRFRALPDFQLRSSELPIMQELRQHAMSDDYEKLKEFSIDLTPGSSPINAFPGPPSFTSTDIPYKYEYQQAAQVVFVTDEQGQVTTKNLSAPRARIYATLPPDAVQIPQGPPPDLVQTNPTSEILPRTIEQLRKLLDERPLVTKRVALNALPPVSESVFKEATQWVGYSFRAGPWRDSLIKYGVDPRSDPKYRIYQTLMFQLDGMDTSKATPAPGTPWTRPSRRAGREEPSDDQTSHVFDGQHVTANGKTWQVCDVTDPVLREIFETTELRTTCDAYQWGWYYNGTLAKARVIMRDKMKYLFAGTAPPDDEYAFVAGMPNRLNKANMRLTLVNAKVVGQHIASLLADVRSLAKAGAVAKQQKVESAGGRGSGQRSDDEMVGGDEDGGFDGVSAGVEVSDDADAGETLREAGGVADADDNDDGDFDEVADEPND